MNLEKLINEAKSKVGEADVAINYFNGRQDILDTKNFFYNDEGVQIENTYASNFKIVNPHFHKLVKQSTNFLFGEPVKFNTENTALGEALKEYVTDETHRLLYNVVEEFSKIGWAWVYVYRNKDGLPDWQVVDSRQVTEYIDDSTGETKAVVRFYDDKVEVWDDDGDKKIYQKDDKGKLRLVQTVKHTLYDEAGSVVQGFGIPWFKVRNNKDETNDLKLIKDVTDTVDLMYSYAVNELQDFPSNTHILKSGGDDNINKIMHNVRATGGIKVDPDVNEGYDVKHNTVSIQARLDMADKSKEAIYAIGNGFDSSQVGSSSGTVTNEVLMAAQRNLINKTREKEIELRVLLKWMLEIILNDIKHKGVGTFEVSDIEIEFTFGLEENKKEKAEIEQIKANAKKTRIDMWLSVGAELDETTLLEGICKELGLNAEEVKARKQTQDYGTLIEEG